ncbi:MAG: Crp/Fnr family transcriptional regulator [Alphaproteobacteria bacterium]
MNSSPQTLFNRLQFGDLISHFPPQIRAQFHNKKEVRVCKAGEVLFKRGDEGPWLGAILSGRVRLCVRAAEGKEVLLSMVERGEVFGERAFFDGTPRAGDAITEEETTFIVITRDEFFPILLSYPEAMMNIIKILCTRINGYINTLELYALQQLPVRVAQVLLFLAQKFGKKDGDHIIVQAGLNQSDISQLVGSSRESVNKQLKSFEAKGYIKVDGNEIALLDIAHLEKMTLPQASE